MRIFYQMNLCFGIHHHSRKVSLGAISLYHQKTQYKREMLPIKISISYPSQAQNTNLPSIIITSIRKHALKYCLRSLAGIQLFNLYILTCIHKCNEKNSERKIQQTMFEGERPN